MLADEQREVSIMEEGNIAVAVGMKNVSSGMGYYAHTHMHYTVYHCFGMIIHTWSDLSICIVIMKISREYKFYVLQMCKIMNN